MGGVGGRLAAEHSGPCTPLKIFQLFSGSDWVPLLSLSKDNWCGFYCIHSYCGNECTSDGAYDLRFIFLNDYL